MELFSPRVVLQPPGSFAVVAAVGKVAAAVAVFVDVPVFVSVLHAGADDDDDDNRDKA